MAPSTTKQWTIEGTSGFEDLKYQDNAPVPRLGERDVLVRFHYAPLNYCDLIMPMGKYSFPNKKPVILGSDGAGTVEEVGSGVSRFKKGDKVASTLSCAALTAWNSIYGLRSNALKPGDTVLTQGTGGVSIFGLQFAKAAGARVIATTSSAI
ncbi:hypothetical protein MMC30_008107 [Trapelia coarctata]|nr:hypothetical protein [Trapelia coarctata]